MACLIILTNPIATTLETDTVNGNPNNNILCGKQIQITSADGTRMALVTVRDRCAGCAMWDLDLTPTVFDEVVAGGLGVGRTGATWKFTT